FNIGVLYAGRRAPYQPRLSTTHTLADLEREFEV
ncbi:MAG: 2-oxoacid:ferredoxin oxidoreductase subunit beta, partial [Rhodospirillales bacterium]|nr:2-oxoacid:ferredoxin oxidoreductase subunit beta [Rhodospirillales bacterium]